MKGWSCMEYLFHDCLHPFSQIALSNISIFTFLDFKYSTLSVHVDGYPGKALLTHAIHTVVFTFLSERGCMM